MKAYVNCTSMNTQRRIIHPVLTKLGCRTKFGFPTDYYSTALKDYTRQRPIVLILDEV